MYKFVGLKSKIVIFFVDVIGSVLFILFTFLKPWSLLRRGKVPSAPAKILVTRADYIGDVILATPILKKLREKYPLSYITFLTSSKSKEVLEGNHYINNIITYDPPWFFKQQLKNALKDYLSIFKEVRKAKYTLALDIRGDMRNIFFLNYLIGIPYRISFASSGGWYLLTKIVPYKKHRHEMEYHLDVIEALGIDVSHNLLPYINITDKDRQLAMVFFKKHSLAGENLIVVIHPGARKELKRWPEDRYAEVGDYLINKYNARIILSGSPEETALVYRVKELMENKKGITVAAGEIISLKVLCAVFEKCSLFIGTSTGPAHLSASVNLPTIILCGPENYNQWRPLGKGHKLIIKDVPCRPCNENNCSRGEKSCLKLIKPEDVYQAINPELSNGGYYKTSP